MNTFTDSGGSGGWGLKGRDPWGNPFGTPWGSSKGFSGGTSNSSGNLYGFTYDYPSDASFGGPGWATGQPSNLWDMVPQQSWASTPILPGSGSTASQGYPSGIPQVPGFNLPHSQTNPLDATYYVPPDVAAARQQQWGSTGSWGTPAGQTFTYDPKLGIPR